MTASVDLVALRALAEQANEGLLDWWPEDFFAEAPLPTDVARFLASCPPASLLALIEAVEAARRFMEPREVPGGEEGGWDPAEWDEWAELHALAAALAPFEAQT